MAYPCYGWSDNEQATGPDVPMTMHGAGYDGGAIDLAEAWHNNAHEGAVMPADLIGVGDSEFSYDGLVRDTAMIERPSHQADQEQQPQVGCDGVQASAVRSQEEEWDYAVEVWPGLGDDDAEGLKSLADHIYHIHAELEKKDLDYHLTFQDPSTPEDLPLFGQCRRYLLPRQYRHHERSRFQFLQVFSADRLYNKALEGYRYKMGVVYESSRNPLPTGAYASSPGGNHGPRVTGFNPLNPNGDPTLIPSTPSTPSTTSPAPTTPHQRSTSPLDFEDIKDSKVGAAKTPQPRLKPIPKPQRQVVKNREGRFICTWHGCDAAVKDFARKCEWSKHMDKHERPYKCQAVGCENVAGFTYSGGLLRHEREVHRKHGGPKNPLFCPHKGCKRHKNSSFARLENLNEHLRRCHTASGPDAPRISEEPEPSIGVQSLPDAGSPLPLSPMPVMTSPIIGSKRKADDDDLREEIKRLRFDNQELKRKIEAGYLQQRAMMDQIDALEKERDTLLGQLKEVGLVDPTDSIL
ncbi:hypothetical protein F5Y14DRAFT_446948 [Nemania sp. NC0429]|nr:hypothetical protein F5Y14DRAFT_446948 [Nemania sp. NC0429]